MNISGVGMPAAAWSDSLSRSSSTAQSDSIQNNNNNPNPRGFVDDVVDSLKSMGFDVSGLKPGRANGSQGAHGQHDAQGGSDEPPGGDPMRSAFNQFVHDLLSVLHHNNSGGGGNESQGQGVSGAGSGGGYNNAVSSIQQLANSFSSGSSFSLGSNTLDTLQADFSKLADLMDNKSNSKPTVQIFLTNLTVNVSEHSSSGAIGGAGSLFMTSV